MFLKKKLFFEKKTLLKQKNFFFNFGRKTFLPLAPKSLDA